ncbi:MAG: hypothetical protein JWN27_2919 [Candidatus Eremiobacteraeota bacterium]|nr:hypothetical protein [Candidatus Eremiobacteraeota bacterium]
MLTEAQVRKQFDNVICTSCQRSAAKHGLHDEAYVKGTCVWTWIGVVRTALERAAQ